MKKPVLVKSQWVYQYECPECGVVDTITLDAYDLKRAYQGTYYCPHCRTWTPYDFNILSNKSKLEEVQHA